MAEDIVIDRRLPNGIAAMDRVTGRLRALSRLEIARLGGAAGRANAVARLHANTGRTGMGSWDDFDPGFPDASQWPGSTYPSNSPTPTQVIVGGAIHTGLNVLRDIYAPTQTSQAAYRAQASTALAQQPIYQVAPNQYLPQRSPGGVGFGVDGQGIRLSDGSHIGWFPIAGVVLAFVLIQSRPLTRR